MAYGDRECPLSFHPPRGHSPNWRIRGSHLGTPVDRSTGSPDEIISRQILHRVANDIEVVAAGDLESPDPWLQPELQRTSADPAFIYAIQCSQFLKVGIAADVARRFEQFRLYNPFPCIVAFKREINPLMARTVEARTHALLRPSAHGREWFSATLEAVVNAIEEAVSTVGGPFEYPAPAREARSASVRGRQA